MCGKDILINTTYMYRDVNNEYQKALHCLGTEKNN